MYNGLRIHENMSEQLGDRIYLEVLRQRNSFEILIIFGLKLDQSTESLGLDIHWES